MSIDRSRVLPRGDVLALGYAGVALATIGVFGFSLASVAVPAALYMLLLVDGIARPSSSVLYPTITHGSRNGRYVALSFDDGPDPQVTPIVLDVLKRFGARATFFTIGKSLQAQPLLAKRIVAERHELGNHSLAHSRWQAFLGARKQEQEIKNGAQAITQVTGAAGSALYRPPIGLKSPPMARAAQRLDLTIVAWSLHSQDTRISDPTRIARRVLDNIRPGDIVLMHDGHDVPGRRRPACAQALPLILQGLSDRGLSCVTVSELLKHERDDGTEAGWLHALWRGLKAHAGLKMLAGWLGTGVFFVGYFLLLKFPLWPVTMMPLTAVDRWIPFWPGALWLYVTLWVYIFLPPGVLTDRRELLDYYRAMLVLSLAGLLVFLLWPTASPQTVLDWERYPPLGGFIAADDTGNAFPSMHVAFAVFAAIWLDRLLRRVDAPAVLRIASAAWGAAIVYSTLATRQHVLVDVAGGGALGWAAASLHGRWQRNKARGQAMPTSPPEPPAAPARGDAELLDANRRFYDPLWRDSKLIDPERFNTWPLVQSLTTPTVRRLEIAPGLRPRLPIAGTTFVDISEPALERLQARGGLTALASISAIPFGEKAFDLVCALDIIEHVDDDDSALSELSRVAAPGATFLLSVPLHPAMWTAFDDFVGHRRRYEPEQLQQLLLRHGFRVEQSAVYGMQPKSSRLLDIGMWFLTHRRERSMWWYNRVFMPVGLHFQSELNWVAGMISDADVAEIVMVCRKP